MDSSCMDIKSFYQLASLIFASIMHCSVVGVGVPSSSNPLSYAHRSRLKMSECQVFEPPHLKKSLAAVTPASSPTTGEAATFEQFQQWQREQEQLKQSQQSMTEQERQFHQFQQWQEQQQFRQWQQQQQHSHSQPDSQHQQAQQSQTRQIQASPVNADTNQASRGQTTQQVPVETTSETKRSSDGCGLFDALDNANQHMSKLDATQTKATSQIQNLLTTFHTLVTNFENMLGVCKHVTN